MQREELLQRFGKLFSAVLCDAMDAMGLRQQSMVPGLAPVIPASIAVGFARTALSAPKPGIPDRPYEKELALIDELTPGDIVIFAALNDASAGVWGGLLSTAARAKGATGAVIDGVTRDAAHIRSLGFPVFARGLSPRDSLGRSETVAYDVEVECAGCVVAPGDLVFADEDGVVAIPRKHAVEILEAAERKVSREKIVEEEFRKGRKVAEVFAEYGIL
jgi:4-hydroxy-4-methyl-2-oxoglutarate aldolase